MNEGNAFQVDKLQELSDKYLSDKAKEALKKSSPATIIQEGDKIYQCVYFGTRTLLSNVEKGAKEVADKVNDLADKGLIHSALTHPVPLIKYNLAKIPGEELSTLVLCYVLVPAETYLQIQKDKLAFEAGGMPKCEDDLKIKLLEGEFFYNPRLYCPMLSSKYDDQKGKDEWLDNQLKTIIAILPPGTIVVSKTQCSQDDLSLQFECRLYNPLMQEVKLVELDTVRSFARIAEGVKEFNLINRIIYKNIDDKDLYKEMT